MPYSPALFSRLQVTSVFDMPDHWRVCAEEARTIAEGMKNPETKRMMLGVAESYERMARMAAERPKKKATPTPMK